MSHDGLGGLLHGAVRAGLISHVLDKDGRHAALLVRLVDERGGSRACAAGKSRVGRCDGRAGIVVDGTGAVVKLSQSIGQVLGVHELVGSILETILPAVGRARGRRDEEELAGVGKSEVLISLIDRCRLAKVDAALLTHDGLVVPDLSDGDGRLLVVEGDDDASERLERGEGVDGGRLGDEVADDVEVLGEEDGRVGEVGEEEGV